MMRSLFSGVAGLQNHQVRMDVLGNNIANVNTTGFKKGRVNFQDLLYQQMSGAARPTPEIGGVNPKEIGLGMMIASIDTIHTQGSLQTTGVGTDLAVQGTGFFVLKNGEKSFFTRAGAFGLDQAGTLVNPSNGLRVQGWMARDVEGTQRIDVARDVEDLIIPVGSKDPAKATTSVNFACNLDKRTAEIPVGAGPGATLEGTWGTDFKIYDSFGQEHTLRVDFTRVPGTNNQWQATTRVDPESATATNASVGLGGPGAAAGGANTFTLEFSNLGTLAAARDAQGNVSAAEGDVSLRLAFDVLGSSPGDDGAPERQEFAINLGRIGSVVNTVTQFAERSSTKAFMQDGYPMGYLENFKIDQSGIITGVYSNGTNRLLGQVAMASFTNPGGLEKSGENNFVVSNNSGLANITPSGVAGKGKLIAGALEMSNVDLAEQFTDMIVTQRGFQANSKTIQTSDQMLQELLTLKR
ncbi:flagellar hook protein FlgE [Treponema sp.]